jgi:hypothetical protein
LPRLATNSESHHGTAQGFCDSTITTDIKKNGIMKARAALEWSSDGFTCSFQVSPFRAFLALEYSTFATPLKKLGEYE